MEIALTLLGIILATSSIAFPILLILKLFGKLKNVNNWWVLVTGIFALLPIIAKQLSS